MNHAETDRSALAPLMLVRAAAVRPQQTSDVAQWRDRARVQYAAAEPTPYRGLTEMLFAQMGQRAVWVTQHPHVSPGARYRDAGTQTQAELAHQALATLIESLPDAASLRHCRLALYAAASVDEHFYQSTIGRLAATFGFSSVPHFSIGQLQGASLCAAAELIAAMLPNDGDAALFVCAEKWPTPFPRVCDAPAVLGDGAAAMWFERAHRCGVRYAGGKQQSFDPFLARCMHSGEPMPSIAMIDLLDAAADLIANCLEEHDLCRQDIAGWIASGISSQADEALRERLGIAAPLAAKPRIDDGYLCAASSGMSMADVLEHVRRGEIADDALLLSWGASFGGAIGVALWRVARCGGSA
jgi:3-oxoacyl-[acyl-carrier-protein] synthase III